MKKSRVVKSHPNKFSCIRQYAKRQKLNLYISDFFVNPVSVEINIMCEDSKI